MRVSLALLCLAGALVQAQSYRGEAVPVTQRVDPIEFSRLRFLTFAFGREGPMDTPLPTSPVMGREYFVEADIFGIESVATIRFELLDPTGRALQTLTMWKATDSSTDGEFYGFLTVPNLPFRAVVTGTNTNGAAFRAVLNTPFQPAVNGPPDQPILPAGIAAQQMAAYHQQVQARAVQAAREHPNGVITLSRAVVSRIAYEPLGLAAGGQPIGMRLRYSMQFPTRKTIVAMPHVFPVYQQFAWRGTVAMKPLTGTITPAPQMEGVQSLQDVIVYQAAATYQASVTYTFTIDMVPDFVFQGTQSGRFCIHEQKFTNRPVWDALKASQAAIPYSVTINDTETFATIPSYFPQRTFYESFVAAGAFDCGPQPNIRF